MNDLTYQQNTKESRTYHLRYQILCHVVLNFLLPVPLELVSKKTLASRIYAQTHVH